MFCCRLKLASTCLWPRSFIAPEANHSVLYSVCRCSSFRGCCRYVREITWTKPSILECSPSICLQSFSAIASVSNGHLLYHVISRRQASFLLAAVVLLPESSARRSILGINVLLELTEENQTKQNTISLGSAEFYLACVSNTMRSQ